MNELQERLRDLQPHQLTFEGLEKVVQSIAFDQLDYETHLPKPTRADDYARNILVLDPLECVLIYWPPGVHSAIHHHEGFYGYVQVLKGAFEDIVYDWNGEVLREKKVSHCLEGGLIDEPDGVIHQLGNASEEEGAVTMHFYYPALETMEGMRIFDLEQRRLGILNEQGSTASWSNPPEAFERIDENAFTYEPPHRSHKIVLVKPKPDPDTIAEFLADYYDEQAHEYDDFDLMDPTRRPYTKTIDRLVAEGLKKHPIKSMLAIAVGTGRRAIDIREQSGLDYGITGIDMSNEMCGLAAQKGIRTHHGTWMGVDMDADAQFDVATFLYAFGHIPTDELRRSTLRKLHQHLKPGARFYFDAFNVEDESEWGPKALAAYQNERMDKFGYEPGDVFYQKTGGAAIAFLHYFSEGKLRELLKDCGFSIASVRYVGYVRRSGEIVESPKEGFFFVEAVCEK